MTPIWLLALCGVVAAERGYLFTAPKVFISGQPENVCLTLFDVPETGNLKLGFKTPKDASASHIHTQEVSGVADGAKQTCFEVPTPDEPGSNVELTLSVSFPSAANYSIEGSRAIEINGRQMPGEYLFIQTDKSLYKPGQLVRFRVFSVDSDLLPIREPFPLIYVESPVGTRLAQWRDETGQHGLVQLELQLSEQPSLGEWKIHVQTSSGKKQEKAFTVDEYVLPKFEVTIEGPPFILGDDKEVTWKVCGRYTYGKPVQGNATIEVSSGWRRDNKRTRTRETSDDGCASMRFSGKVLGLGDGRVRPYYFRVKANLTEDGTDVTLGASAHFSVDYTKLKLTHSGQSQRLYFKPGLPFVDRITVSHPDDTPAVGEPVQVCLEFKRNKSKSELDDRSESEPVCHNMTSDSAGIVHFTVAAQDQEVQQITVKAEALLSPETKYPESLDHYRWPWMRKQELQYVVKGWYSESGAFLQLERKPDKKYACGTSADLSIFYTARLGSQFELFYQVMGRGDLLVSGSTPVTSNEAAELATELSSGTVIGRPGTEPAPVGLAKLSIPVTPSMSSGFKVLVFVVVDGEVVADSQSYDAEPCLNNAVALRWSPSRARPQEAVQLTVAAEPGSLCGLDVVDKSVNLLSSKNRISLADFFDRLKQLNLKSWSGRTQINDREYCTAKYGDANVQSTTEEPSSDYDIPEDLFKGENRPAPAPAASSSPGFGWGGFRRSYDFRRSYWTTTHADSLTAFDEYGWCVLTDLQDEVRPCQRKHSVDYFYEYDMEYDAAYDAVESDEDRSSSLDEGVALSSPGFAGPQPGIAGEAAAAAPPPPPSAVPDVVRTYFPETWLFDLHSVSEDGTVTLQEKVPDTITEWVAGAVCTSETAGLGIAPPASLISFQPFFVSYTLPYSVKRGETLVLKVSVLNYNQDALPIKLTLVESDEFETLTAPVVTSCVSAGVAEVVPYRLRPGALGDVNITVVAEVYPEFPSVCGPEIVLSFRDAITRPILVEPEGFEREITYSSFMCVTPERSELSGGPADLDVSWPLALPTDLVPGSERARVSVAGDLLGPSIDNLESMVRKPTGCGEQNMVLFAPNIDVMKYLTAVGELTEQLKQKLVNFMKIGYQRELNYRHDDKSYSAFGNSDDSGSMWLTGFVVKSFANARKYIFIDESDLSSSVRWIESRQTENGCFPSVGKVLHKEMKGGVASGGEQALTAYITIALIQSGVDLQSNTITDAFSCLQDESVSSDLYTLTLRTYAHAVAGHWDQARTGLAQLKERATREGGLLYWSNSGSDKNKGLSVEMGAYNILTMKLLEGAGDGNKHFSDALGAVRWITQQRNNHGGFVSTQDTVLALEALAVFSAGLPRSTDADLRVHLSDGHQLDDTVRVTAANRLLVQRRDVSRLPGEVRVRAEGTGCALVQAMLNYNVFGASPSDALTIAVTSKPKRYQQHCLKHTVEICVSYLKEDGETNMAVVELEMVSGFIPNKGSLKDLKDDVDLDLKRWEVNNNKVVFYFDSLDQRKRCFEVVVQREQEVEDAKQAVAKVYDYYQEEFSLSTSYALDVECETVPIFHLEPEPVPLPAADGGLQPGVPELSGPFGGFAVVDDFLLLPEGPEGVAPRLAAPPLGFLEPANGQPDKDSEDDSGSTAPLCPVCLDAIRKEDFGYYMCLDGRVLIGSLGEAGTLSYRSSWSLKGKPRRLKLQQQIAMTDGCDCMLDTGRPLYVFGVTADQLKQSLLLLTDEHVLAAAPPASRLRHRQIELARNKGCQ